MDYLPKNREKKG